MTTDLINDRVLETGKVLLRPIRTCDFVHLLPYSIGEPGLWKYSLLTAAGAENLRIYLEAAEEGRRLQREYPFIVYDKQSQRYVGSTRFYDILPQYQTLQLGYTWYGREYQGTYINKHCKYLLLKFAFEEWNMERVELRADNRNERSIAAMKSIGCKVDGVLRSNMPTHTGTRRDSIVLSILKDEWFDGVKEALKQKIELL